MTELSDRSALEPAQQPGLRPVDAPLLEPAPATGLSEVFRRRYLLRMLVKREISARYQQSFLGFLWSYINPLSQLFIYAVIMGVLVGLGGDLPNYALHVFAGLTIVHFFGETFAGGTRSIVRNKALVKKMAVPREMFPVASVITSFIHVIPQIVILTVACLVVGWHPDLVGFAAGLLGLSIVLVLGLALALMFALANVYFRDVGSTVGILTNFVRFSVPMIYPYTVVEERSGGHEGLYLLNPVADAVLLMQRCFWTPTFPDDAGAKVGMTRDEFAAAQLPEHLFTRGLLALAGAVVVLLVAQIVFSRLDNRIPERLAA